MATTIKDRLRDFDPREWECESEPPEPRLDVAHLIKIDPYRSFHHPITERQQSVLTAAEARGYLFDPQPERESYGLLDYPGIAGDFAGVWDTRYSGHDVQARTLDKRRNWWPRAWRRYLDGLSVWLPRKLDHKWNLLRRVTCATHFALWHVHAVKELRQPAVLAGSFGPCHVLTPPGSEPALGVMVASSTADRENNVRWPRLLDVARAAAGSCKRRPWLHFDGVALSVNVPPEDAEHLAATFWDILQEDGWETSHRSNSPEPVGRTIR